MNDNCECGSGHVSREVFDAIWEAAEKEKAARAEAMPIEQDAIKALNQAYQRLKELGWNDPIYCPKDDSHFDEIDRMTADQSHESPALDYDSAGRDGLFDDKQRFAVFSHEDTRRLIARLQSALDEALQA